MNSIAIFKKKMMAVIKSLPDNTPASRQMVYRKTREFVVLSKYAHMVPELEEAVAEIEADYAQPDGPSQFISDPTARTGQDFRKRGKSWRGVIIAGVVVVLLALAAVQWLSSNTKADTEFDHGFSQYSSSPQGTEGIPSWSTYYTAKTDDGVTVVEAKGPVPLYSNQAFPVDPAKSYKVSARVRVIADDAGRKGALTSAGIVAIDANGKIIGKTFNTAQYAAMSSKLVSTKDGWVTGEATMTFGGKEPAMQFPPETKSIRLVALLNVASPNAVSQIDYLRFAETPSP